MINVVLFQPEIPPNTGNIIRLCANCGADLHLIKPLGFAWDDKRLRRAGLDYHEFTKVHQYNTLDEYVKQHPNSRIFACETIGAKTYSDVTYDHGDSLLFGPETRGLPNDVINSVEHDRRVRIPMLPNSRSLNLSNSVAIIVYEAWRQLGFKTT